MSLPRLSLMDTRHLHLAAQGLLKRTCRRATSVDVLATISCMSSLQIDAIGIVAHSSYLVLLSCLGDYLPRWLDDSLWQGELVEYWAHEACLLLRSDFILIRHRMLAPENMGWKYKVVWMKEHAHEIEQLLQHIQHSEPARSADSERPREGTSGW